MSGVTLADEECDGTLANKVLAIPDLPPGGTTASVRTIPGKGYA